MLRSRFGHDLHIDGELVQTATGGLLLTVRGDGIPSRSFTRDATDLARLTTEAAEYVFAQSEPAVFARYLMRNQQLDEVIKFAKAAFSNTDAAQRPFLLNLWGVALLNSGGDKHEGISRLQMALKLKPDYWSVYLNLMAVMGALGDEEGAWRTGEEMRRAAGGRPGKAMEVAYFNWDALTWNLQAARTSVLENLTVFSGGGGSVTSAGAMVSDIDLRLHDAADAELQIQTAQAAAGGTTVAAMTHFVRGRLASAAGDTARAVSEMEAFGAAFDDPIVASTYPGYNCWIGLAEEAAGHRDKADAALQAGGHYIDCYRFKADVLDGRGDWPGAQLAYQAAVDLAPDLPAAYYSWGLALARHDAAAGAKSKFEDANRRGPHWADPLKAWGDVLAKEGDWRAALAKYDEALRYAPAWTELHAAREEASRRAG